MNKSNINPNQVFDWSDVPVYENNVNTYSIQIDTSASFTSLLINTSTGSASQYTLTLNLINGKRYY